MTSGHLPPVGHVSC